MDFSAHYRAARRVSTPLVCVRTFDAKSAVDKIRSALGESISEEALILWDVMHGLRGLTERGLQELGLLLNGIEPDATCDLVTTLRLLEHATTNVTVFVSNAHLYWTGEAPVIQGIWNLRDGYKANGNMLILMCSPGSVLPPELSNDVLVLDDPLPSPDDIRQSVSDTFKFAKVDGPNAEIMDKATDALIGVPPFAAEQATAMCLSITKSGEQRTGSLDLHELWEHKRKVIGQVPGLSVYRGTETLDDIGGLSQIKKFFGLLMNGKDVPKAILFIDEIEKAVAGAGTDMSGVKGEMHGTMLSWMQDADISGMLFIGLPGTSKSFFTKCGGNTYGKPTINFDLSGMQGGIIGQSGAQLRHAQKTVDAISGGNALCIATCNSIEALSPELRSRFTLGTFFFDAPDRAEKDAIWKIHRAKWGIDPSQANPQDDGWVGREIAECCKKAHRLNVSLQDAAQYVVPVTKSSAELIHNLRLRSSNKYLSASKPGLYTYSESGTAQKGTASTIAEAPRGRVLRTED